MSAENGVLAALHRAELSPSRSCDPVTLRDVDTFIDALAAAGYHVVQAGTVPPWMEQVPPPAATDGNYNHHGEHWYRLSRG